MPVLEAFEQLASAEQIPVDSRIETGRTARHALRRLLEEENFDRLVVLADNGDSAGFSPTDIAWLLATAPTEVLVLKPEGRSVVPPAQGEFEHGTLEELVEAKQR
jgi:hypothetical protein